MGETSKFSYYAVLLCTGTIALLGAGLVIHMAVSIQAFKESLMEESEEFKVIANEVWDDIMGEVRPDRSPRQAGYGGYSAVPLFDNQKGSENGAGNSYGKTGGCCENECPAGPPGAPGRVGYAGVDGIAGVPGKTGPSGTSLHYPPIRRACVTCPPGAPGAKGPSGPTGHIGFPGLPGMEGRPGMNGRAGHMGPQGDQGLAGQPGLAGKPGYQGQGGYRFVGAKPGPPGPPGMPGVAGRPGASGLPGLNGAIGHMGVAGDKGQDGSVGYNGRDGQEGRPGQPGQDADYCPCPNRPAVEPDTGADVYDATSAPTNNDKYPTINKQGTAYRFLI